MATVALNHEEIKKDPQITSKIKPFINKHNLKGIFEERLRKII